MSIHKQISRCGSLEHTEVGRLAEQFTHDIERIKAIVANAPLDTVGTGVDTHTVQRNKEACRTVQCIVDHMDQQLTNYNNRPYRIRSISAGDYSHYVNKCVEEAKRIATQLQ